MGNVAAITSGPSNIFIKAYDGTFPAFSGAAADFSAFTNPGFTEDGIEWDYTPSWKDFVVDEKLSPVRKKLTAHKLLISAKLAETTLANLFFGIAGGTLPDATHFTIGSPDDAPEFSVGWLGPCPPTTGTTPGTREALVYRCVSMAASKIKYDRKNMAVYQVQFEALSESGQPTAADLASYQDFPTTPFVLV
jgi:hypothetical protein